MPKAEIVQLNGAPAVAIDGKPLFLNAPYLHKAPYESFAEAATGVYMVFDHAFAVDPDGVVDTADAAGELDALFAVEPTARAIVRFFPPVPDWWLDAHPGECVLHDRPLPPGKHPMRDASWGSELWAGEVCGWIETFCRDLHARYRGRIIGFQFGMGEAGENNQASNSGGRWFCGDFSDPMLSWFRRWLDRHYATDMELAEAWGMPGVTRRTATIPDRVERLRSDWFTFRDPRRRQVADYYEAFADRVEELVIRICETIKRATGGETLAGSHLGAFLDNGLHAYLYEQTAINRARRALLHPAVDLFTSPASYLNRQPGGDGNSMMPTGTYRLHGKLIFQDQDSRTHLVPSATRRRYRLGRLPEHAAEAIGVLTRDFGHAVIRGYGLWWHAMVPGMYDHPAISSCIAQLADIGRASLAFPRGGPDDVAMLVDDRSAFHQQCANRLFQPMLYHQRQHEWGRSGLAWDAYHWQDLFHPDFPRHKLYVCLNLFYLTSVDVDRIRERLSGSGATVVWMFAPGIQGPDGFSLDRTEALSGFRLRSLDIEALPRVAITDVDHPYTSFATDLPEFASIGSGTLGNDEREGIVGPIFYADDPDAQVLGELECVPRPGLAVKRMDGWTSVYLAAPWLHRHLLRAIGRAAGAHVYQAGEDVVLPGRSFLMVHAVEAGRKRLDLRGHPVCYDPYSDEEYALPDGQLEITMARHSSRLLFMGTAAEYRGAAASAASLAPGAEDATHLVPG